METIILHKCCKSCQKDKPLTDFYVVPTGRLGVAARCKPCYNAYNVSKRKENAGKRKKRPPTEREKESKRKYSRGYSKKNPTKIRANLLRQYKLTTQQYEEMFTEQNGVCAICQQPPKNNRRLAVDHDHKTGQVRGLLCTACNLLLGRVHDDITALQSAIKYLQKH